MKIFWLLSCHTMFIICLMLFTLNAETNFPSAFTIKAAALGNFNVVLDWFALAALTLIFGFATLITNRICYSLIFRLNMPVHFRNDIGLLVAMALKYTLPMVLVVLLDINGRSVMFHMPVTYTCFRIFMGLSMLFDMMVYFFKYNEKTEVTVRIGKWTFSYPCKRIYNVLTFLLWSNFFGTLVSLYKHKYSTEKQHYTR